MLSWGALLWWAFSNVVMPWLKARQEDPARLERKREGRVREAAEEAERSATRDVTQMDRALGGGDLRRAAELLRDVPVGPPSA